jgi:hypothetical protein
MEHLDALRIRNGFVTSTFDLKIAGQYAGLVHASVLFRRVNKPD